jgi:hypothetical protein
MAYSDFTFEAAMQKFDLHQKSISLFSQSESGTISEWLKKSLIYGKKLALSSGNEKARSEFIIAPIMIEIEQLFGSQFAIYSGKNLDADKENGLSGECDFIISKGEQTFTIQAPILAIVEAKKADIELGLGQCVAQMVGAKIINARQGEADVIYGCVTTGEDWQFMKLEDRVVYIDCDRYYINQVEKIVGCLQSILNLSISH